METRKIVVIGGVERSGTTLTKELLQGHTDLVVGLNEFVGFSNLGGIARQTGVHRPRSIHDMERIVDVLLEHVRLSAGQLNPEATRRMASRFPIAWDSVFLILIEQIWVQFPGRLVVLKHPLADLKFRMLDLLLRANRWDPRFIYLVRNPLDVYLSFRSRIHAWKSGMAHTDTLSQCGRWIESTGQALEFERLRPGTIILTKYEDVVADPVAHCRQLCSWLGIEDQSQKMVHREFGANTSFHQAEVLPVAGSVLNMPARSREQLSQAELELYQVACGERAKVFGYDLGTARTDARNYQYLSRHMSLSQLNVREYTQFMWRELLRRATRILLTLYSQVTGKKTSLQLRVTPGPPPVAER